MFGGRVRGNHLRTPAAGSRGLIAETPGPRSLSEPRVGPGGPGSEVTPEGSQDVRTEGLRLLMGKLRRKMGSQGRSEGDEEEEEAGRARRRRRKAAAGGGRDEDQAAGSQRLKMGTRTKSHQESRHL